jgi:triacylglycerol lipase
MGWKDIQPIIEYFYQIPETLTKEGAQAFSANQLSFAGQKESGESLAVIVGEILAATGKKKVNLIAQSQGGPMVRYMLENLTVATKDGNVPAYEVVASFTSISSPHRGTPICDAIVGLLPEGSIGNSILTGALDAVTGFIWSEDTDSQRAFVETSTQYMKEVFNETHPLVNGANGGYHNGVYNQSYSGKMTGLTLNALIFVPTHLLITAYDGFGTETDGFVSVPSSKFGVDRGIIKGAWWGGGVDHAYENNLFFGMTPGFDAKEFYIELVEDLKNMGF